MTCPKLAFLLLVFTMSFPINGHSRALVIFTCRGEDGTGFVKTLNSSHVGGLNLVTWTDEGKTVFSQDQHITIWEGPEYAPTRVQFEDLHRVKIMELKDNVLIDTDGTVHTAVSCKFDA